MAREGADSAYTASGNEKKAAQCQMAAAALLAAATLASAAPFLALACVDFAPAAVFEDAIPLSTVSLAVFVLATMEQAPARAAALAAAAWLVHGLALRIRAPLPARLYQARAGDARVGGRVAVAAEDARAPLRLPDPPLAPKNWNFA